VYLSNLDGMLDLRIVDNGIGFDTEQSFEGHLGLHSMSERAARIKAVLTITSQPGDGTTVDLQVTPR